MGLGGVDSPLRLILDTVAPFRFLLAVVVGSVGRFLSGKCGMHPSEQVPVGAGAAPLNVDPATTDRHSRCNLEKLEADLPNAGFGKAGSHKHLGPQLLHHQVSECTKPQPHLVGSKTATAGAVGKQIHLLLFDAVFHISASTIKIFVQLLGAILPLGEVGDNKTRVAPFLQQLGFAEPSF